MKHQYLWALPIMALLAFSNCSNDDSTQENAKQLSNNDTARMTEFAVEEILNQTGTRTMGIYSGKGIDFYWTDGDDLWINSGLGTSPLIKNSKNNISGKTATAKFYFDGKYTAESYPVRYTGKGNTVGDKVTIKSVQNQKEPNDGSHIGTDGDCGTAIAHRNNDGKYKFTLAHKAAYITFTPYYHYGFADDVKVTKIKVTAHKALAGEFSFNDDGIDLSTRPKPESSNQSITLNLNGGGLNGFPIPSKPDIDKNAAIMVIAPGTYDNFTVEYTLHDSKTLEGGTVTKNYGTLIFNAGKNKRVSADLAVPHYPSNIYYMWDAAVNEDAWKGHEKYQPTLRDETNNEHYPQNESDPRWHNTLSFPASATRSAKNSPNANELLWYAHKGDPHWDASMWSIMKHLYRGGMWLKKRNIIATENHKSLAELKKTAPDGRNYTEISTDPKIYEKFEQDNKTIAKGKPENSDNYILLPAFGYYLTAAFPIGGLKPSQFRFIGQKGYYWSSTPRPDQDLNGYNLYIAVDRVHTGYGNRSNAHCLWPVE